jgi:hypothetical protein
LANATGPCCAWAFAGAFRRSELCALEVADLTVPDGPRIPIRRSKGDQEDAGQEVAIPRSYRLRPVEAVQACLAAAEISAGPVFRAVTRGGPVSCEGLADDSAARIVKRYAQPGRPGSSVLRRPQPAQRVPHVGSGVGRLDLEAQRGVKSLDTLRGYVRRVDLFKGHAGAAFLQSLGTKPAIRRSRFSHPAVSSRHCHSPRRGCTLV